MFKHSRPHSILHLIPHSLTPFFRRSYKLRWLQQKLSGTKRKKDTCKWIQQQQQQQLTAAIMEGDRTRRTAYICYYVHTHGSSQSEADKERGRGQFIHEEKKNSFLCCSPLLPSSLFAIVLLTCTHVVVVSQAKAAAGAIKQIMRDNRTKYDCIGGSRYITREEAEAIVQKKSANLLPVMYKRNRMCRDVWEEDKLKAFGRGRLSKKKGAVLWLTSWLTD